ncbi:uncharacterized protein LOC143035616 [Oratosquilla oratoria]|uniref:uncharacterized protein LOC143035616 n=1 Tax=Oratosquilla oratoria TaxID=337810 RepID=UPI003F76E0A7
MGGNGLTLSLNLRRAFEWTCLNQSSQPISSNTTAAKSKNLLISVDFLKHTVSSTGISPLDIKCDAIRRFPKPYTQRQLKQFLGMINFYSRFIFKCSLMLQPLYSFIRPCKRGQSIKLAWCPKAEEAFASAKTALDTGTTLRLPGEFIPDVPHSNSYTPHHFAFKLKETMAKLHPVPPRQAKSPKTFVSQDLLQCTHVFVRTDAVRKALRPPYEGPIRNFAPHQEDHDNSVKRKA